MQYAISGGLRVSRPGSGALPPTGPVVPDILIGTGLCSPLRGEESVS